MGVTHATKRGRYVAVVLGLMALAFTAGLLLQNHQSTEKGSVELDEELDEMKTCKACTDAGYVWVTKNAGEKESYCYHYSASDGRPSGWCPSMFSNCALTCPVKEGKCAKFCAKNTKSWEDKCNWRSCTSCDAC